MNLPDKQGQNLSPSEIMENAVAARIEVIADILDMDNSSALEAYCKSINLENLTPEDKKVLSELIPYAYGLMIPSYLEERDPFKVFFDMIDHAEVQAGANSLNPSGEEIPSDECIKNAVAGFRALIIALEKIGLFEMRDLAREQFTNAMARMFVDIRYPVPPEIMEKIDEDEYEKLKIMSLMHTEGSIMGEKEFQKRNREIKEGEKVELPPETFLSTSGKVQKILDIYAEEHKEQRAIELKRMEDERYQLARLYMEFLGRYPDMDALISFLFDPHGKAEPLEERKTGATKATD